MADPGPLTARHAGALVPLFSIPSRRSWGIGETADLPIFARWLESAGLDFVQLLPINEMQEGQSSPYSALSAMAIDPIFIALDDVEEFAESGGESSLDAAEHANLAVVRGSAQLDYARVRTLKTAALARAFERFRREHWERGSARAVAFRRFCDEARWWLDDYALFRALHDEQGGKYWVEWDAPLRDRDPRGLAAARERLADRILFYEYLQWLADVQWHRARDACGRISILGDFPFMVSGHSADVWSRQAEFRVEASVGVPPDAFSETGQDWGLPVYRWEVIAARDYEWLRNRTRRCAELFDGFRVDHLVGFYRTFVREQDGSTYFVPDREDAQRAQGERLMRIFGSAGGRILAEDLGTVPDFVRDSMAALGVPGMKVFRWERLWETPGRPFRDPAQYPKVSVATSGTHDTETMAEWWDCADDDERREVQKLPALRGRITDTAAAYSGDLRDALLEALLHARSDLVILPVQDVFGWRDRINRPASVSNENWTWRLPFAVDDLLTRHDAQERASFLRRVSHEARRL